METGEDVLAKLEETTQQQNTPPGIVGSRTNIRGHEISMQSSKNASSKRSSRKVSFPDDDSLVSSVEAPDPWKNGKLPWQIVRAVFLCNIEYFVEVINRNAFSALFRVRFCRTSSGH